MSHVALIYAVLWKSRTQVQNCVSAFVHVNVLPHVSQYHKILIWDCKAWLLYTVESVVFITFCLQACVLCIIRSVNTQLSSSCYWSLPLPLRQSNCRRIGRRVTNRTPFRWSIYCNPEITPVSNCARNVELAACIIPASSKPILPVCAIYFTNWSHTAQSSE